MSGEATWFVYVVRCCDDTLYTGVTTDVDRRVEEHNVSPRGARYTRARRPVSLQASWACPDRSIAMKAEYAVKQLERSEKLELIDGADFCAVTGLGESGDQGSFLITRNSRSSST